MVIKLHVVDVVDMDFGVYILVEWDAATFLFVDVLCHHLESRHFGLKVRS